MEEYTKLKSTFSVGDKKLHEMPYDELLQSVEQVWNIKNGEIAKYKAERDAYLEMLKSPLVIHGLWSKVADNFGLLFMFAVMAYLLGKAAV